MYAISVVNIHSNPMNPQPFVYRETVKGADPTLPLVTPIVFTTEEEAERTAANARALHERSGYRYTVVKVDLR